MLGTKYMASSLVAMLVGVSASLEERPCTGECAEVTQGASFVQMEAHRGRGQDFDEEETGTMKSEMAAMRKSMAEMLSQITDLRKEVTELRKSSPFTVSGNTVKLQDKDLHIRSGNLKVDAASGLKKGNIVIGNNNVANARHSFAAGYMNTVEGKAHFVIGAQNTARGLRVSLLGGGANLATGDDSVIVGGHHNTATHAKSVVLGGAHQSTSHDSEIVS